MEDRSQRQFGTCVTRLWILAHLGLNNSRSGPVLSIQYFKRLNTRWPEVDEMLELQHIADPALASTDSMSAFGILGAKESYTVIRLLLCGSSYALAW